MSFTYLNASGDGYSKDWLTAASMFLVATEDVEVYSLVSSQIEKSHLKAAADKQYGPVESGYQAIISVWEIKCLFYKACPSNS